MPGRLRTASSPVSYTHLGEEFVLVGEDGLQFADLYHQGSQFLLDLAALQTGELAQTHGDDGRGLHVVKAKALHQPLFALGDALALPQYGNDLVDEVPVSYTHLDVYKRQGL